EEAALHAALLRLARGAALVDGLNDLEGQADARHFLERAVLVVLAGPNQLGLGDVNLCHARQSSRGSSSKSVSAMSSQPWSKVKVRALPAGSWMRTRRASPVPARSTTYSQ